MKEKIELNNISLDKIMNKSEIVEIYNKKQGEKLDLIDRRIDIFNDKNVAYRIVSKEETVGIALLYNIDKDNRNAKIDGFIIDEKNKAELREALCHLMKYAFEELLLHKISTNYISLNYFNEYIWNNLRFVYEGHLRDSVFLNEKYYSVELKGFLCHEYKRFYLDEEHVRYTIFET